MKIFGLLVVALTVTSALAGCTNKKDDGGPGPTQTTTTTSTTTTPTNTTTTTTPPREPEVILNATLKYRTAPATNEADAFTVDADAIGLDISLVLRATAAGQATLNQEPGQQSAFTQMKPPTATAEKANWANVADTGATAGKVYDDPTFNIEPPEAGEWAITLSGVGTNVEVYVQATQRFN